ncbi:PIF1-like protein [Mya arenaria]|uniref:PIF1-like protein n=1 Tax=Mya arenaria TaxID=6604 RepID=A0ABY7FAN9_MYAAR|nr:PIF1-like protein [Mya arenaria]
MNAGQQQATNIAIAGHNLLLLGAAGTGKSFVVKEIFDRLSQRGLSDGRYSPNDINTIHANTAHFKYVNHNHDNVQCIIVDECSMLSKRTFELIIAVCSRKISTMQLIFVGDFFQLPTVANLLYEDDG